MKAPRVVLDKDGRRVRLRNLAFALTGSISGDEGGKQVHIPYRLEPNRWTTVHPLVYELLRRKFENPVEHMVPDWEPGGENDRPQRTPRVDQDQEYIIEFGEN